LFNLFGSDFIKKLFVLGSQILILTHVLILVSIYFFLNALELLFLLLQLSLVGFMLIF
jgi:hypothetical protein